MRKAEAVARYFAHLAATAGEPAPLAPLRLRCLMYYAQGWRLAAEDQPLFEDEIRVRADGPEIEGLNGLLAGLEGDSAADAEAAAEATLSGHERGIVESVWLSYGCLSGEQLSEMVRAESPARLARGSGDRAGGDAPISHASLRDHFRRAHDSWCRRAGIDPEKLRRSIEDARVGRTIDWASLKAQLEMDRPEEGRDAADRTPRRRVG